MPSLVTAVAVEVIFAVSATLAAGGIGAFLLKAGGVVLLNVLSSKLLGPKIPDQISSLREISVMTRSAVEYRKRVYGDAVVSGPVVYNNLTGEGNSDLWYVIALADGAGTGIEGVKSIYIDGEEIPVSDIDWTPGVGGADGTGTGDVSTAKWVGANSTNALQIYWTLGDDNQVAMSKLTGAFSDWTTNHRLRGVAYLVVRCIYNTDTEEIWRNGAPQNIRALVDGCKVYDPRNDSTNGGTGPQRYDDKSTWLYSSNPALCLANYLQDVMGVDPATGIEWPMIIDAANDCDALVSVPAPDIQEFRFTCNGAINYGTSHKDNLDSLISAMAGTLAYSAGAWQVRASVWDAPTVSFDDDDLAGGVQVQGSAPSNERRNTIRGVFVDPARNYEPVEFPIVSDSTYVTRDNGRVLTSDLELPMTNSETMAQRIAFRVLEQYDNQQLVSMKLNARGAKVAVGQTFNLSLEAYGWVDKVFRCIEWRRNTDGSFDIAGREDTSARYADPAAGDYDSSNTGGVTYPGAEVPPPTGLGAVATAGGINVSWQNPPANSYDYIDVYASPDNQWSNASRIASVRANTYTHTLTGGTQRWYWIRAVREPDVESIRNPDSDTSTIQATAQGGADGADALSVNYTNYSHTVPVTNAGVETWTGSGGQFFVYEGTAALVLNSSSQSTSYPVQPGRFNINITRLSGDTLTEPGISGAGTQAATLADWAGNLTTATVYRITAYIRTAAGLTLTFAADLTLTPSIEGADGQPGFDGDDAVTSQLTNPSPAVPTNNDGSSPIYDNAGGTHKVYSGSTDVTNSSFHSVQGGSTKNGLTLSVDGLSGVYSLSGASWSSDQEQFTLRAVYGPTSYDKLITVTKAKAEAGTPPVTGIGAIAVDVEFGGGNASAGVQINSDGDVYKYQGSGAPYVSQGTWRNVGVSGDYEVMFEGTGDTPDGSQVNVWLDASVTRSWTHTRSSTGTDSFTGVFKWRDKNTLGLLATADATVEAEKTV